jgi:isopenicillin N synthase-like dioxygenase
MTSANMLDPALLGERVELDHLPIIDLTLFLHGSPAERKSVAVAIGQACRDIGFFAITYHDVPTDLVERTFAQCAEFFALPTEEKAAISIRQSQNHRGWFEVGGENLDPAKQTYAGDYKEGIKIGQDLPPHHVLVQQGVALHGPNQWPARPAEFTPTLREYYYVMTSLARQLLRGFALALEIDETFFDDKFSRPMATAGPLHYPPQTGQITETQLGAGAHTDFGALTIVAQDDVGGLQVRSLAGTWIDVPPLPGAFIVNVGDMMARWTNDLFTSTVHRVINVSGRERYSIPFFFDPNYDAPVVALATCVSDERPVKYPPTTGMDHLLEMINASFDYRDQKDSASGSVESDV